MQLELALKNPETLNLVHTGRETDWGVGAGGAEARMLVLAAEKQAPEVRAAAAT